MGEFSEYLISPLRKRYDTMFKSTMCTLKALRCWLKLKPSKIIPTGWIEKRQKICERLDNLDNEVDKDTLEEITTQEVSYEGNEVRMIRCRNGNHILEWRKLSDYREISWKIMIREDC